MNNVWRPQVGEKFTGKQFAIKGVQQIPIRNGAKAGTNFMKLTVGRADLVKDLEWTLFDWTPEQVVFLKEAQIVAITGQIGEYNKNLQIKHDQFWPVEPEAYNPNDFVKQSPYDLDEMWKEFEKVCASVKHPDLRALLFRMFHEDGGVKNEFKEKYIIWPAAKGMHHAWVSGLLRHVLEMVAFAETACKQYNRLFPVFNREIVLVAIILHDMAKLVEYKMSTTIEFCLDGELFGHLNIAAEWLTDWQRELEMDANIYRELKHCILSHHGEESKGHGSIKTPITPNAWLVHFCDNMSAKMTGLWQVVSNGIAGLNFDENGRMERAVLLDDGRRGTMYIGFDPNLMQMLTDIRENNAEAAAE